MDFKLEQIIIADRIIDRIEEDGVYWFPLTSFFDRILFKKNVTREYRDSSLIKYMKVFEFKPSYSTSTVKAWCMNEMGIKYILKRISVKNTRNIDIDELRRKNLLEACIYFKIKRIDDLESKYINIAPDIKDYDIWSYLCLTHDFDLKQGDTWKLCDECGYYYPDNAHYFVTNAKRKTTDVCIQCSGKDFKCKNEIMNYLYYHDGLNLLFELNKHKRDNEKIINELDMLINKGGAPYDN